MSKCSFASRSLVGASSSQPRSFGSVNAAPSNESVSDQGIHGQLGSHSPQADPAAQLRVLEISQETDDGLHHLVPREQRVVVVPGFGNDDERLRC